VEEFRLILFFLKKCKLIKKFFKTDFIFSFFLLPSFFYLLYFSSFVDIWLALFCLVLV